MQIVINNTPVWITYRDLSDISGTELVDLLGYSADIKLSKVDLHTLNEELSNLSGFYFATCSPGCLPDSDFYGPYSTEKEAMEAANEHYKDE